MNNLIGIGISYFFIFFVIIMANLLERLGSEATRKFIHIVLCNWWFIAMYFFDNVIWASIVPISFIIINYLSYQRNLIKVMERGQENQGGLGTVYYAISLLLLILFSFGIKKDPSIGLIGSLVMGYGDGLAAIIGKKIPSKQFSIGNYTKKTIAGSITMFIITFLIIAIFYFSFPFWYLKAAIFSLLVTVIEAISIKGTDNLTVPLASTALVLIIFF